MSSLLKHGWQGSAQNRWERGIDPIESSRACALSYGRSVLQEKSGYSYADFVKKIQTYTRKLNCAGLIDSYYDNALFDEAGGEVDWASETASHREINDPEASHIFHRMLRHTATYGKMNAENLRMRLREMPKEILTLHTLNGVDLPSTILIRNVHKKRPFGLSSAASVHSALALEP